MYHSIAECPGVKEKFRPLTAFTYGELEEQPFSKLKKCDYCQPVSRKETLEKISEKYGFGSLQKRKSLGGSDAAYTTNAGIPTADGLGIVGYNLHSTKEKAEIKSLAEGAKLLAAIILELAQGDKNE